MQPMHAIRAQYFLTFAVQGSLIPYLSVLLADKGLGDAQIGDVMGVMGLAILLGPVTMTLLADLRLESRTLLAAAFTGAGAMLMALLFAEGFWPILIVFGIHALLALPIIQVQDGLNFAVQHQRRENGDTPVPYHRVRVWGTFGYMLPAVLLYAWLAAGAPVTVTLIAASGFCALGIVNTRWLPAIRTTNPTASTAPPDVPDPRANQNGNGNGNGNGNDNAPRGRLSGLARRAAQVPTLAALRAMLEPRVLVFVAALWLCHLAAAGYYTFYPIYVTRQVGLGSEWLGLIANIGVAVEIAFVLGFGYLVKRFGLPTLMALAAAGTAVRLLLLCAWPNVWIAVGTQLFHGLTVLLIHIGPPVFLNQRAEPAYRSSMQGLYAMLIYGTGRIVGNMLAGRIAEVSVMWVFGTGAILCLVAAALFAVAFGRLHESSRTEGAASS